MTRDALIARLKFCEGANMSSVPVPAHVLRAILGLPACNKSTSTPGTDAVAKASAAPLKLGAK